MNTVEAKQGAMDHPATLASFVLLRKKLQKNLKVLNLNGPEWQGEIIPTKALQNSCHDPENLKFIRHK